MSSPERAPIKPKRVKHCMSIKTKMNIIRRVSVGETYSSLGRKYNVNESSIRTIVKNADKIKASLEHCNPIHSGLRSRARNVTILKMENILTEWIGEDPNRLVSTAVREKALNIYEALKANGEEATSDTFTASKGWYHRFLRRLKGVKPTEESKNVISSVEWNELKNIIEEESYDHRQIFNLYSTSLNWKRLPARVNNTIEPNMDSAKQKINLILGSDIGGEFKCRPLLTYLVERFRNIVNTESDSIYIKPTLTDGISVKIFEDWFLNYFCKDVEQHCYEIGLEFKVVLIVDGSFDVSSNLSELHPQVKVVILPKNITESLQEIRKGLVASFKLHYTKKIFKDIIDMQDVSGFLKNYSVFSAAKNIVQAWTDTSLAIFIRVWDVLCKDGVCFVTSSMESDGVSSNDILEALQMARSIPGKGFVNLEESDVINLIYSLKNEEENAYNVQESKNINLYRKQLSKLVSMGDDLIAHAIDVDPDKERSRKFAKDLNVLLSGYKKLYQNMC